MIRRNSHQSAKTFVLVSVAATVLAASMSAPAFAVVLTAGGLQGAYPHETVSTACDLLDPSTGNDALTGSMHTARDHHTATVLQNGEVLAAGGHSQNQKGFYYTNTAELYTP